MVPDISKNNKVSQGTPAKSRKVPPSPGRIAKTTDTPSRSRKKKKEEDDEEWGVSKYTNKEDWGVSKHSNDDWFPKKNNKKDDWKNSYGEKEKKSSFNFHADSDHYKRLKQYDEFLKFAKKRKGSVFLDVISEEDYDPFPDAMPPPVKKDEFESAYVRPGKRHSIVSQNFDLWDPLPPITPKKTTGSRKEGDKLGQYKGPLSSWQRTADNYIDSDMRQRTRKRISYNKTNGSHHTWGPSENSPPEFNKSLADKELWWTRKKKPQTGSRRVPFHTET